MKEDEGFQDFRISIKLWMFTIVHTIVQAISRQNTSILLSFAQSKSWMLEVHRYAWLLCWPERFRSQNKTAASTPATSKVKSHDIRLGYLGFASS